MAVLCGAGGSDEVVGKVYTVELAGFQEREKDGSDVGAAAGFGAVVVFAADDGAAEGTLGGVVVKRHGGIAEKYREPFPISQGIRGCRIDGNRGGS